MQPSLEGVHAVRCWTTPPPVRPEAWCSSRACHPGRRCRPPPARPPGGSAARPRGGAPHRRSAAPRRSGEPSRTSASGRRRPRPAKARRTRSSAQPQGGEQLVRPARPSAPRTSPAAVDGSCWSRVEASRRSAARRPSSGCGQGPPPPRRATRGSRSRPRPGAVALLGVVRAQVQPRRTARPRADAVDRRRVAGHDQDRSRRRGGGALVAQPHVVAVEAQQVVLHRCSDHCTAHTSIMPKRRARPRTTASTTSAACGHTTTWCTSGSARLLSYDDGAARV